MATARPRWARCSSRTAPTRLAVADLQRGHPPPPARDHRADPRLSELAARGRAGRARPPPHHRPWSISTPRRAYAQAATGPCDDLRQDRRRARAPGRAGRAGGEDHRAPCWSCRTCASAGCAPIRTPTAPIRRTPTGSSAASPRSSTSCRRGASRVPDRGCFAASPVRAALPADVPQRRRSRPDALRHHASPARRRRVPLRPVVPRAHHARHRAQGADAARASSPMQRRSRDRADAAGRDPDGLWPTACAWLHAGRVLVRGRAAPIVTGPNRSSTRGSISPACRTRASATRS